MAFTKLLRDLSYISKLDDEPNDVGGLSAAELKAEFDRAANEIKEYINETLIGELEGPGGAGSIGIAAVAGLTGADSVQAALRKLVEMMQEMTQGSVADGSIGTAKLANAAVTALKLADLCVGTAALQNLCVTTGKIDSNAVTTGKLAGLCVTAEKLAALAVITSKLADKAVTTAKIADGAVGTTQIDDFAVTEAKLFNAAVVTAKLRDGAVTPEKTTGIQRKHLTAAVTLPASGWIGNRQTVSAAGVTSANTVLSSPAAASWESARDNGVRCTEQSAGTLTFTCDSVPGGNLSYNIVILD